MKKIVLFALLAVVAVPACDRESWRETRRDAEGKIYITDSIYLPENKYVTYIEHGDLTKVLDEDDEGGRRSCRISFAGKLTVVDKYNVQGVKNLLTQYSAPSDDDMPASFAPCRSGFFVSLRESDWRELRKNSRNVYESWIIKKYEPQAEREALRRYVESGKKNTKKK